MSEWSAFALIPFCSAKNGCIWRWGWPIGRPSLLNTTLLLYSAPRPIFKVPSMMLGSGSTMEPATSVTWNSLANPPNNAW
ncbi:hypothetical protein D3C81_1628150 [compost metagenome]